VETPAEQIVKAARRHGVDAVGLLVTGASELQATAEQLRRILAELPRRVALWIGGSAGPDLTIRDDALRIVATWRDLDEAISRLTPRSRDETVIAASALPVPPPDV
jgi:hypothetical protein